MHRVLLLFFSFGNEKKKKKKRKKDSHVIFTNERTFYWSVSDICPNFASLTSTKSNKIWMRKRRHQLRSSPEATVTVRTSVARIPSCHRLFSCLARLANKNQSIINSTPKAFGISSNLITSSIRFTRKRVPTICENIPILVTILNQRCHYISKMIVQLSWKYLVCILRRS